ncbi:hypothetical protein Tco_0954272 [Tanacetum coccineum]|uniref:Uncharacterized protein n=1 Tax=Tanacetum coccineum TaxID=301880 RepID=A0ABQ5E3N5_9ASTR
MMMMTMMAAAVVVGGVEVAAREVVDQIDPGTGSTFGLGQNIRRKSFSVAGGGGGGGGVAGGRKIWEREREIYVGVTMATDSPSETMLKNKEKIIVTEPEAASVASLNISKHIRTRQSTKSAQNLAAVANKCLLKQARIMPRMSQVLEMEQGEAEKEIGLDHGCLLLPRTTNGKAIVVPVVRVNHVVKVKLSYPFKQVQIAIEAVTLMWS